MGFCAKAALERRHKVYVGVDLFNVSLLLSQLYVYRI